MCSRCYLYGEEVEMVSNNPTLEDFISLRGIVWIMPNRITHLLYSWEEVGVGASYRDRWRIVLDPVFGGQSGKRNASVLREKVVIFRRSK